MQGSEVNIKVQKIYDTIKLLKSKTALVSSELNIKHEHYAKLHSYVMSSVLAP